MAEQIPRYSDSDRPPRLLRWRLLAILIMVAGAVAFALTLIMYGENFFCLSGSTLLTMVGLGLLVTARRRGWEPAGNDPPPQAMPTQSAWSRSRQGGRVPPGLRAEKLARHAAQAPLIEKEADNPRSEAQPEPVGPQEVLLADQVLAILTAQGARVTVALRRPDRSILHITAAGGQEHTALVLEGSAPAEATEARALLALLNQDSGRQAGLGYLIAAGGFSPAAYQWAEGRAQIRLVGADELDELGL